MGSKYVASYRIKLEWYSMEKALVSDVVIEVELSDRISYLNFIINLEVSYLGASLGENVGTERGSCNGLSVWNGAATIEDY